MKQPPCFMLALGGCLYNKARCAESNPYLMPYKVSHSVFVIARIVWQLIYKHFSYTEMPANVCEEYMFSCLTDQPTDPSQKEMRNLGVESPTVIFRGVVLLW